MCPWRLLLIVGLLALPAPSFAQRCGTDEDCGPGPDSCNRFYCGAEGYCAVEPLADGTYCDDGNICTQGDMCVSGGCVAGPPFVCDDGDPCTDDVCDPAAGCTNRPAPDGATCDDGNVCTQVDVCVAGACAPGPPVACDDGDPCTDDVCDPAAGCRNQPAPDGATCDDGNACTASDQCLAGACTPGRPITCDDGDPCTDDVCQPGPGCVHAAAADGTPCDADANACTAHDQCSSGSCAPGPPLPCDDGNPCTADTCDPGSGCLPVRVADGTPCDLDADLCTQDVCAAGACRPGHLLPCDDGNTCTIDFCREGSCVFIADTGAPCDDGNACNQADICNQDGVCTGGPDVDTDGDGLADCYDGCPGDGSKFEPGVCGCYRPDVDSDGDGRLDCQESCPDDPLKTAPGVCGCGVSDTDSDADGTADCRDGCPSDPAKTEPRICGCGTADTDSDGDGTPNCHDGCPSDPVKTEPGICGCGTADADSDSDRTPDCNDGCPADPSKTEPQVCGCGVEDVDADGDGALDCVDLCDDDPNKAEPGICGCGELDADTDLDGTADCHDGCPADPGKVVPGVCGCGTADADVDLDGVLDCRDNCPRVANADQADGDRDGIGDLCEPLDHFLSYRIKPGNGAPRFAHRAVMLQDAFRQSNFVIRRPVGLLNPAEKTHAGTVTGIGNPDLHYLSYHVNGAPFRLDDVRVHNQFGDLTLDLRRPDRLLVPAFKALPGGTLPPGTPRGADHYLCYRANLSGDRDDEGEDDDDDETCDPRFPRGVRAGLLDEFNLRRDFEVVRPTRFCAPAVETYEGETHGADVNNPANNLTCYRVRPVHGDAKHQRVHGIQTRDQFGDYLVDTQKEREVCVPSTRTAP